VKEKARAPVSHVSFGDSLRHCQRLQAISGRRGVFGMGDFAHTLLILLAVQKLTPDLGATSAAGWAAGLYCYTTCCTPDFQ